MRSAVLLQHRAAPAEFCAHHQHSPFPTCFLAKSALPLLRGGGLRKKTSGEGGEGKMCWWTCGHTMRACVKHMGCQKFAMTGLAAICVETKQTQWWQHKWVRVSARE